MGTPEFAVPSLETLIENTNVVLVVCQPDKEVGRKKELTMCPIKRKALENNIEVFQPKKIREDFKRIKELQPDLIVTCAYGQILPQELLDIPTIASINIHASLLPKYRGSAPIQWVLLNGEEKTGITLMYMDAGMDTGDTFAKCEYQIKPEDNYGTLHDTLAYMGANLLKENLDNIINNKTKRVKQNDSEATIAPRINRDDELIDLSDTGENIINKIRAFNHYPLAYLKCNNLEFKVIDATFKPMNNSIIGKITREKDKLGIEVKDGIIYFNKIKPIGKKEMDIKSFLNGLKWG